jgi:hypothetical protein
MFEAECMSMAAHRTLLLQGMLFFVNFNDQALYSVALDEAGFANNESGVARQITPANSGLRYADFAFRCIKESSHLRQGRSPSG